MTKGNGGKPSHVGYGKPPKASQWKPGQSGNPSGKSKVKPTGKPFAKALQDELASPVRINLDGKSVMMSLNEVIAKKVARRLADADITTLPSILRVLQKLGVFSKTDEVQEDQSQDEPVFTEYHRRLLEIARSDAGMD